MNIVLSQDDEEFRCADKTVKSHVSPVEIKKHLRADLNFRRVRSLSAGLSPADLPQNMKQIAQSSPMSSSAA